MTRREMMKDGLPMKVLQYLSSHEATTSKELKLALKVNSMSIHRTLTTVKKKNFVSQKEKGEPYFLTPKGMSILRSFDVPVDNDIEVFKKPGAPSNGKITNGIIKFNRPASMSQTMFSELVSEHSTAERRCEAIENLFQSWPR